MFRYIQDKELRNSLREYCEDKIISVQKQLKDFFTFSFKLIGSGDNRLMMINGKNNSIDLDYNLVIQRDKKQLIGDPKRIKILFVDAFRKVCGKSVKVSDSTSVITCVIGPYQEFSFSFDVAIMIDGNNGYLYKIINDKTASQSRYIWNQVPKSKNFEYKFSVLKQKGYWNDIKELYLSKKNNNLRKHIDKTSFSVLIETVNEIIQSYHLNI